LIGHLVSEANYVDWQQFNADPRVRAV